MPLKKSAPNKMENKKSDLEINPHKKPSPIFKNNAVNDVGDSVVLQTYRY